MAVQPSITTSVQMHGIETVAAIGLLRPAGPLGADVAEDDPLGPLGLDRVAPGVFHGEVLRW